MSSIATDAANDIYRGPDGNLAIVTGIDATLQECEHVMKAQQGEMPLALTRGVPTMATIWDRFQPVQFIAAGRAMLLSIAHVVAVRDFKVVRNGDVANYAATIQTDFTSNISLNGEIIQP